MEAKIVYLGQAIFCTTAEQLLLVSEADQLGNADIRISLIAFFSFVRSRTPSYHLENVNLEPSQLKLQAGVLCSLSTQESSPSQVTQCSESIGGRSVHTGEDCSSIGFYMFSSNFTSQEMDLMDELNFSMLPTIPKDSCSSR